MNLKNIGPGGLAKKNAWLTMVKPSKCLENHEHQPENNENALENRPKIVKNHNLSKYIVNDG